MSIAVRRSRLIEPARAAAASRAALTWPLAEEAELWIAGIAAAAISVGAFQRGTALPAGVLARRGSGGAAAAVGRGTLHVALLLPHPAALVACDAPRLVNRYVRPLLRALGKSGAPAHWFGRDWVSVKRRPAAAVGFAHDAATRRSVVEALIAVSTPFAVAPRASFLGNEPGTLESITGTTVDPARLADAIVAAYAHAYGRAAVDAGEWPDIASIEDDPRSDPPWLATVDEAIGELGAGPDRTGRFRVGGDLLVSADALHRLEDAVVTAPEDDLPRLIDDTLAAPGVALDGVRSLSSVRDVILRARGAKP